MSNTQIDSVLPLLPLPGGVLLPGMVISMAADSDEARAAVEAAGQVGGRLICVPRVGTGFAKVGVVAGVEEMATLPNGTRAVAVRALHRGVVGAGVAGPGKATWVETQEVEEVAVEEPGQDGAVDEMVREYRAVVESILEARGARPWTASLRSVTEPGALADTAGYLPELSFERRVELLETIDPVARLRSALAWARAILAEDSLKQRIRTDVTEGMEAAQRQFLLRQQLAAIRKELGEGDEAGLTDEYRTRLAETPLPDKARQAAIREIERLEKMSEASPEHGWVRTWLDTLLGLPWGKLASETAEVAAARAVLDADHHGLDDVKDRIIEHLAVRQLRTSRGRGAAEGRGAGSVLALVGPPGVGKTSLGASVARALGRPFVRMALGGVRDEAEIRGHRRTYVGALPGRVVRAIEEAGTMNPVVLLDEVDKLGADWRGDPSSALLEVLDPAQNHTFRDHYLDVDLDLSEVVFLATANVADTIPPALLDRMDVVRLDGYTEDEKVAIATDHLLPRQVERAGLDPGEVSVEQEALRALAGEYTREAGVRGLDRHLARVLRKVAASLASGSATAPVRVGTEELSGYLGRPHFADRPDERPDGPGAATGLAVTGAGGDVLVVEVAALPAGVGWAGGGGWGSGGLVLTGQLGEVMKESAEIALSWVRSHAVALDLDPTGALSGRFHVHVPAGAVPKDGPSAGVTMVTALVSLLRDQPVRAGLAMTGEVSLQGRVLPVGGIKQKVLAAHRAGMTDLILPKANGPDLDDVPQGVQDGIQVHLVSRLEEAVAVALGPPAAQAAAA